jgi:formate hydrogenlyase subunit 6/NADH:ubiquinone oxidoreductase subunit I
MAFKLTEEQQDFSNNLRRFFEKEVTSSYIRKTIESESRFDFKLYSNFKKFGLAEVYSDKDSALVAITEFACLAIESGRSLCPVPFVELLISGPLLFSSFLKPESIKAIMVVL